TARGLQQLRDKRDSLLEKKRVLDNDESNMSNKAALAKIERELRYFSARVNSAILVDNNLQDKNIVSRARVPLTKLKRDLCGTCLQAVLIQRSPKDKLNKWKLHQKQSKGRN
ncbi:hypothetical protein IH785_15095, partial [candidate division KSB1 bacterium]|nr:hypothetical protein [candidate division KSB1 bacterium]